MLRLPSLLADIQEQLAAQGFERADAANEDFRRLVSDEMRKWTKVVQATGFKVD